MGTHKKEQGMTNTETNLVKILGEEKAVELCEKLGNSRLPGKKFCNRINRIKFQNDLRQYGGGSTMANYAEKYGVSIATIYNWMRRM